MAIYTKTGDEGTTSLVTGRRVSKCSPRVEAYGDADELISYLAVLRCSVIGTDAAAESSTLKRIQLKLMNVSAWLACDEPAAKLQPLSECEVQFLEAEIDRITALLPKQDSFIIPSPPQASAQCHYARTICRRCERRIVAIEDKTEQDVHCMKYINRLSDYLFVLARYLCIAEGAPEEKWLP